MATPLLVFRGGVAAPVGTGIRKDPEYRRYRAAIRAAETFGELLAVLEGAVRGPWRAFAAADFAPHASYARRFVNTTALYAAQPNPRDGRRLKRARAQRVLANLLGGAASRPGRRPSPSIPPQQIETARAATARWRALLATLWEDRASLPSRVAHAAGPWWTPVHGRALNRLLAKPTLRPSRVAAQLAAWELDLPLRAVRASGHPPEVQYG